MYGTSNRTENKPTHLSETLQALIGLNLSHPCPSWPQRRFVLDVTLIVVQMAHAFSYYQTLIFFQHPTLINSVKKNIGNFSVFSLGVKVSVSSDSWTPYFGSMSSSTCFPLVRPGEVARARHAPRYHHHVHRHWVHSNLGFSRFDLEWGAKSHCHRYKFPHCLRLQLNLYSVI